MVPCPRCVGMFGKCARISQKLNMLGRTLRWTDDGPEYEADEKHRQELLSGLGLYEESKNGQQRSRQKQKSTPRRTKSREVRRSSGVWAATLHSMRMDRSHVQCAAQVRCTKMVSPLKQLSEEGRYCDERDVGDARVGRRIVEDRRSRRPGLVRP